VKYAACSSPLTNGTNDLKDAYRGNMRRFLFFPFILALGVASVQIPVDTTQAQTMVKLLQACHTGKVPDQGIEQAMLLPGTQLIVAQQNISRRITSAQYRAVLVDACKGKVAQIEPFDSGARAKKGVQGLIEDVAPSLLWDGITFPF
jgi:hypothetical protein